MPRGRRACTRAGGWIDGVILTAWVAATGSCPCRVRTGEQGDRRRDRDPVPRGAERRPPRGACCVRGRRPREPGAAWTIQAARAEVHGRRDGALTRLRGAR